VLNGVIHQILQHGAAFDVNGRPGRIDAVVRKPQHNAPEPIVRDNKVCAASNHNGFEAALSRKLQRCDKARRITRFDVNVRSSANAEPRVAGHWNIAKNGGEGHCGETCKRLFDQIHFLDYRNRVHEECIQGFSG